MSYQKGIFLGSTCFPNTVNPDCEPNFYVTCVTLAISARITKVKGESVNTNFLLG